MTRRVVITGIGLVTPLGIGVKPSWEGLKAGKSGIGRITHFDPTEYTCQIAGQVPNYNADDYFSSKEQKKLDKFIQFGMIAADEAIKDAGIENLDESTSLRTGAMLGSGIGGLAEIEHTYDILKERGPRRVSPFFIPSILINLFPGHVTMKYGFKGPSNSVVTACATGAHAIGNAMNSIRYDEADIIVAGGAEACICPSSVAGFASAKALSKGYNDTPEKACRPFDSERDGFIMAEGAGVLVLEEYEHAKKRGATIYAEVAGFGQTSDAYHMTMPHPEGEGGARAINLALQNAKMEASEIDYVNAHATSTPAGDEIESKSIESVFGPDILVSATKSMIGHMLGAAGGVEAAICALTLRDQIVAPTINLDNPSDNCNLDYVPNKAREVNITSALSNSFGFGGTNASLIFRKI